MAFAINNNLVFIGSMQFTNSSLDALIQNLSDNDFKYLSRQFKSDLFKLVRQKRVYPYEYMDSFKKFFEDKSPDKCELHNSLKDKYISEKDYLHPINVFNVFKMNTTSDYRDHYLKADNLLLADVFEKFLIHVQNIMYQIIVIILVDLD